MYTNKLLLTFLFFFQIIGFSIQGQQADNKKPMYGEVPQSEAFKKLDELFIQSATEQFGSREKASQAHIKFGWKYFYNDSLVLAMKRFNQAWLLDAEQPDAYFGFAALTEMKGNKEEAKRYYKIGMEKDKNKNRAEICFQRIADCKEQLKDYQGAAEAYQNVISINPGNVFAYKKLGYYDSFLEKDAEALENYTKAIELDPNDEMTYNNRGYLYQKMKKYPEAIEDYSMAIKLKPEYISAYVNRGLTKVESNDFQGAKNDFQKSCELDPNSGELMRLLGLAKLRLKDTKGACIDFEIAKKLGDWQAQELINQNCK
jgi:tetratricopeptide (TPR) repeat protein